MATPSQLIGQTITHYRIIESSGVAAWVSGCNPTTPTLNPSCGSKVIAIVADLAKFSMQFGLPAANFSKVFA